MIKVVRMGSNSLFYQYKENYSLFGSVIVSSQVKYTTDEDKFPYLLVVFCHIFQKTEINIVAGVTRFCHTDHRAEIKV